MTCETALEQMLEAGPAALRGEDGGELARHVAECPRCARIAATLLRETGAVDRALDEWARATPADAAADVALAAAREDPGAGVVPLRHDRGLGAVEVPGAHQWSWTRKAWVPLAAAAALAGVLFLGRDQGPGASPSRAAGPPVEPRVSVTPPSDRSAAIMETGNPDITIVWLYQKEGS